METAGRGAFAIWIYDIEIDDWFILNSLCVSMWAQTREGSLEVKAIMHKEPSFSLWKVARCDFSKQVIMVLELWQGGGKVQSVEIKLQGYL